MLKTSVTTEAAAAAIVRGGRNQPHHGHRVFPDAGRTGRALPRAADGLARAGRACNCSTTRRCWSTRGICHPTMPRRRQTTCSALGAGLKVSEGGEIDVDDGSGKVVSRFLPELQRDLGLAYRPEHWDEVRLATWLCRNLPGAIADPCQQAGLRGRVADRTAAPGRLHAGARQFAEVPDSQSDRGAHPRTAQTSGGQGLPADLVRRRRRVARRGDATSTLSSSTHRPMRPAAITTARFGHFDFRKHFYGRIGDFDSKEEFECACWLDIQAQKGRIQFWVRNLVRREGSSFFLQKADGRFYPDFLCQLPGSEDQPGAVLAVEYKGADRWAAAEDDRLDRWPVGRTFRGALPLRDGQGQAMGMDRGEAEMSGLQQGLFQFDNCCQALSSRFDAHRLRRAQLLRKQADAQFLEQPAEFVEPRVAAALQLGHAAQPALLQRPQLGQPLASRAGSARSLSRRSVDGLQVARQVLQLAPRASPA